MKGKMSLFSWFFKKGNMDKNQEELAERWKVPTDDECGWIPIRPTERKFDYYRDAKPDTTPTNLPVLRKEVVYNGNGVNLIVERGGEYPDWQFPVVVPNVLLDKKYTAEQIKEIAFIHRTHCLKQPPIGHPEFEPSDPVTDRENIKKWVDLSEDLFLELDQRSFDTILSELKRKLPGLDLTWKRGRLWVNGAKTRIRAKNIDKAWKTLKEIGVERDIIDFIVELIGKQLSEVFVP